VEFLTDSCVAADLSIDFTIDFTIHLAMNPGSHLQPLNIRSQVAGEVVAKTSASSSWLLVCVRAA
jgi:hypothetical protein